MVTNSQSAQVRSAGCVETIKLSTQLTIYITLHYITLYNVNNKSAQSAVINDLRPAHSTHCVQSARLSAVSLTQCSQPDSVQSARLSAVSPTQCSQPDSVQSARLKGHQTHFPHERVGSGYKTTIPQEHSRVC